MLVGTVSLFCSYKRLTIILATLHNPQPSTLSASIVSSSSYCESYYNLYDEVNKSFKSSSLGLINEKSVMVSDDGRSIKQLYFNNMQLFGYGPSDK